MNLVIHNRAGLRLHRRTRPRRIHAGRVLGRIGSTALLLLLACGALQGGLLLALVGLASWRGLAR